MNILKSFQFYRVVWLSAFVVFILLQCSRVAILIFAPNIVLDQLQLIPLFLYGLLTDAFVAACFLFLFGLLNSLYPKEKFTDGHAFHHMTRQSGFVITLTVFFLICQGLFFSIYGTQINLHAMVNLIDPIPILKNIWDLFPVVEIVLIVCFVGWIIFRLMKSNIKLRNYKAPSVLQRLSGIAVISLVTLLSWSAVKLSAFDALPSGIQKELASNSFYSLSQVGKASLNYVDDYLSLDQKEVVQLLKSEYKIMHDLLDKNLLLRAIDNTQSALAPEKQLNVVMILGESFSVNREGRIPGNHRVLAPEFSSLAKQGHYYHNVYATGQSTSRALAAIYYSVPPLPSEPLLMRKHHQTLDSLPKILKTHGYQTLFVYGGDAHYNSRHTLLTDPLQFDKTIEMKDYDTQSMPSMSSWGVHDEYVMSRTIDEINQLDTSKPFFTSILTLSNHSPYTLPEHFSQIPKHSQRANAIRYADRAIGQFMAQAKNQAWYQDTIFIILADHGPYRSLNPTFPLVDYEIPLLFFAPKYIPAKETHIVASEVDLAPTLLAKLGVNYQSTFFGRNIDKANNGYHPVFLTKFESMGVLLQDTLVQLYPGNTINTWKTSDRQSFDKINMRTDNLTIKTAISYFQAISDRFEKLNNNDI